MVSSPPSFRRWKISISFSLRVVKNPSLVANRTQMHLLKWYQRFRLLKIFSILSAARCTLDQLFQISISALSNETGAASEIFPVAKFLLPTFQTTSLPSRSVPSRQSNPNKTRHWHISERGTLKMKALRLPEAARLTARSPAGEILNLSLSKSAPRNFLKSWGRRSPNCSARFFNKGTIANKVAAAPTWRRDGWEEREIYSRGRIEFPRDCSRRWIAATDRERERHRQFHRIWIFQRGAQPLPAKELTEGA